MLTKIKRYVNLTFGFKNSLLLAFIIISATPLTIMGLFSFIQAERTQYAEKEKIVQNNMTQASKTIEAKIASINRASELLVFNTGIVEMFNQNFKTKSNYQKYALFRDIYNPASKYTTVIAPEVLEMTFYTTAEIGNYRYDILSLDKDSPKRIQTFKHKNLPTWTFEKQRLYVINEIPSVLSPDHRTIIEFVINAKALVSDVLFTGQDFNVSVTQNGQVIFPNKLIPAEKSTVPVEKSFKKNLVGTDWQLNYFVLDTVTTNQSQTILLWTLGLIILSIMIAFLLTRFFTSHIMKILATLKDKVKRVTTNDLEVDFSSPNQDEFGELSNLIGEMLNSIKKLIDEVYNATIEKQDSQYQALVSQINSHFLYNSLSMINWKAIMIENEEISHIAQTLSTFYRTTLNHGQTPIILMEEIENAQAYIDLQLFLQPDSFTVEYQLLENSEEIYVINLLLQPIIENSIEHGFNLRPSDAHLLITTQLDNAGNLIIAVCDNGKGMSEAQLAAVLTNEHSGYGLKNINKRLQFYFGPAYGLTLHSIENQGTTVIMRLPYNHSKTDIKDKKGP